MVVVVIVVVVVVSVVVVGTFVVEDILLKTLNINVVTKVVLKMLLSEYPF